MTPEAEQERLRVLRLYEILDSEAEEQYDNIVSLVAAILQVPSALITIIDEDRQWFKSVLGMDGREGPLELSFCKHMVPTRQPLVIRDATKDERVCDYPNVLDPEGVRFYAGVPIQAREGQVLGALCGVDYKPRDITPEQMRALEILGKQVGDQFELRRTAIELQAAVDKLESAQRARELFFNSISHDIRTPAIGILGASKLLLKEESSGPEAKLLHGIEANGKMLLHLLNDLLDLAKIESGGLEFEEAIVDVDALVRDAIEALSPQAVAKGLELRYECRGGLHPAYKTDAMRMSQVLWNLLSNAIKFTNHGHVEVTLSGTPNGVVLRVSDSGIGIAKEHLSDIFREFGQATTSTQREFGGTGLGLSIVKRLTHLMEGTINVQSEPGVGTTFEIALPLVAADTSLPTDLAPISSTLRVLTVEDNEVNQLILSAMLEELDCEVTFASTCEEAKSMAAGASFDVVLMDCELPDGSGLDLAREFGDRYPDHAIYGISAHTGQQHRQNCLDAGMLGCIAKPFRLEELRLALHGASKPQ